jgi:hypothetical protein
LIVGGLYWRIKYLSSDGELEVGENILKNCCEFHLVIVISGNGAGSGGQDIGFNRSALN